MGQGSTPHESRREELANAATHAAGLVAVLLGLPLLLSQAASRGTAALVGAGVFGTTAALLYLSSTLFHAVKRPGAKARLRVLDHAAIYLLIAGTYTPFTLGVLRGAIGWTLFGLVWTLATAGVVFKAVDGFGHPRLSVALYLAMGWLVLVVAKPLWDVMPGWGVFWLVAGGMAYTLGVPFYASRRVPHGHLIWHLFVLAGTACHYVAVLRYAH